MRAFRRSRSVIVAGVVSSLAVVAALNAIVDPSLAFDHGSLPGLDPFRRLGSRTARASAIARGGRDVVLAGSSRVQAGFDPDSPAWGGRRVLNAGLPHADGRELEGVLALAIQDRGLESIWVELELFPLGRWHGTHDDFETSGLNPGIDGFGYLLSNALGSGATEASLGVLADAARAGGSGPGDRGDRPVPASLPGDRFVLRHYVSETRFWNDYGIDRAKLASLRESLLRGAAAGKRMVVFVPPMHALQQEMLHFAGGWGAMEELLAAMVEVAGEVPGNGPGSIEVWSFLGYGPESCLANWGDPADASPWFTDSSHFRPPVGDRIILQILGAPPAGPFPGVRLGKGNLGAHLEGVREGRKEYRSAHSGDVARLEVLLGELARERTWRRRLARASDLGSRMARR